ncbi:hypothetical protein A3860_33610 [Niastella vici]|uniref:Uncharacterized protein n=1 Tax=Niastella vici TaxID=1703345 RepID=A0A1V9FQ53_9BACT|nr:hypothetical protein A3860_33610 [Niastella vici]
MVPVTRLTCETVSLCYINQIINQNIANEKYNTINNVSITAHAAVNMILADRRFTKNNLLYETN